MPGPWTHRRRWRLTSISPRSAWDCRTARGTMTSWRCNVQKFALEHKLLDKPAFGRLEKPRAGQRDRVPTAAETEAILARASAPFRLIYSALRRCGARPGELCRATIDDIDRTANAIVLR